MALDDTAADRLIQGMSEQVDALTLAAFRAAVSDIEGGRAPREAVQAAFDAFGLGYSDALAASFGDLLSRSITSDQVRRMPIGDAPLSRRLYVMVQEVSEQAAAVVRQHAQGIQQARALSLDLFDGYDPAIGIRRPLERRALPDLPEALRVLVEHQGARDELADLWQSGQLQASRLKTRALRAAYLQAFEAWKDGAAQDAMRWHLEIATREKARYLADRIARTELARAHQADVARSLLADPSFDVVQVRMNPTHPAVDICDMHARADLWGLGPGCYPRAVAPRPPFHPFCLCKLRSRPSLSAASGRQVEAGEAEFLRSMPFYEAARVMGSRAKAERMLNGANLDDIVNEGQDPFYRLVRLADPDATAQAVDRPAG